MTHLSPYESNGATISPCGTYRYKLWRQWDKSKYTAVWIMLNPSTADAEKDDPTIRRVVGFSKIFGYGSCEILNLFALRATNPKELLLHNDPIGPNNDAHLSLCNGHDIICAWGAHTIAVKRESFVRGLLNRSKLFCLGTTKEFHPKHPLYLSANTKLVRL